MDRRFQQFYETHFASTARLARLLTGDADVAEDLAQDAFLRIFRFAESSTHLIENPAAPVRTTTVNVCRAGTRRNGGRRCGWPATVPRPTR